MLSLVAKQSKNRKKDYKFVNGPRCKTFKLQTSQFYRLSQNLPSDRIFLKIDVLCLLCIFYEVMLYARRMKGKLYWKKQFVDFLAVKWSEFWTYKVKQAYTKSRAQKNVFSSCVWGSMQTLRSSSSYRNEVKLLFITSLLLMFTFGCVNFYNLNIFWS